MKVVILAGGFGTRISEESHLKPKPMIEIGEKPIIWHIMKLYSKYGFNDFIICCGYKQHVIKEWFADYYLFNSDVTLDFQKGNELTIHSNVMEPWRVTMIDTGLNTMTGGRVKRIEKYVQDEPFMLTYGDGVSDINIAELVEFHKHHDKIATISTYNVNQRFGVVEIGKENQVTSFREKKSKDGDLINIGYMVLKPQIFDYIEDDETVFEKEPLEKLVSEGQVSAYRHEGFWRCMDTQRDKQYLEQLWGAGEAPWKIW